MGVYRLLARNLAAYVLNCADPAIAGIELLIRCPLRASDRVRKVWRDHGSWRVQVPVARIVNEHPGFPAKRAEEILGDRPMREPEQRAMPPPAEFSTDRVAATL